jgi:hypothetical protein
MGVPFAILTMICNHFLVSGMTWPDPNKFTLYDLFFEFAFKALFFGSIVTFINWSIMEKDYSVYEDRLKRNITKDQST